jgi:hypothetical protein
MLDCRNKKLLLRPEAGMRSAVFNGDGMAGGLRLEEGVFETYRSCIAQLR